MKSTLPAFLTYLWLTTGVTVAEPQCKKDMNKLSTEQTAFVHCAITNAVPVQLCQGCKGAYDSMTDAYDTIFKNCKEEYFDQDRIAIMATMQSILKGIWTKGYCDDCFKDNNSSQVFDGLYSKVTSCFTSPNTVQYNKNTVNKCVECADDYLALNTFFITLDQHNDGKVCYDMQDKMNRTRLHWSKELKCCQREKNMTLFLVVTGIIALFPIAFYSGTFLLTKRRERNHGLLNEQTPELNAPSTRALIAAAIIATPPTDVRPPPPPVVKKPSAKTFVESSDSDSDESVPPRKKV